MYSRAQLTDAFRALGVEPGDVVMLHASVRAVGDVAGGPDEIHLALSDALGNRGTLMMYAGSPRYFDEVGRGEHSPEREAEIMEKLPPYDAATARAAQDHGVLAEFLRSYPGTQFSDHVTRFITRGSRAAELVRRTPWDYAFGHDSTLDRFVALNGKILLLGSDPDNVTFLHYVEHIADFSDKRIAQFKVPIMENGKRLWRDMAEFDTSGRGVHRNWPHDFFARIVAAYLAKAHNRGGRVGDAQSYLFLARELLAFARPVMERVAVDPAAADSLGG